MLFRQLFSLLALPLMASAFGPATPVNSGVSSGNPLTMRVSGGDLKRRGKITSLLDRVVDPSNPAATKAAIETQVLTELNAELLEKCNWKVRKAMIRKVNDLASQYDVEVASDFGMPMPRLEREALEASQAATKSFQRKSHFDQIKADRDARVSARRAAEAGSEADRKKKAAASVAEIEARKKEKEAEKHAAEEEERLKLTAEVANALEKEQEAEAKEAARKGEAEAPKEA